MLKRIGFFIAFFASLVSGCGKENSSVAVEKKIPDAPLIGCYSHADKETNSYIKIDANGASYVINFVSAEGKVMQYDGKERSFKLYEGTENIEKASLTGLAKPPTDEEKEGIKAFAANVERVLLQDTDSGIMFLEVKADIAKEKGAPYFLRTNMMYPQKKIQCPK